jgi:hypothetical protein
MTQFSTILARLLPLLNSDTVEELVFWTEDELYSYMDEACQRLGRFAMFVARDTSTEVESDSRTYALPGACRSVVEISLDGRVLRPAAVEHLEARSRTWTTDTGTVELYTLAAKVVTLWRTPITSGTLSVIYYTWPFAQSHRMPLAVGDCFTWAVLEDARSKAGDGQAMDIAEQAKERVRLYESVFTQYWGEW